MILFISLTSFILDGILSKYISINSLFLPLFTIVSLVLIYPYFNNKNYRYFKYIAILGLLYDIAYMNMIFYNLFIFLILGFINIFIKYLVSHSLYINIITTIILITTYRFINFIFINITIGNINYTQLFKTIYSSFILNIIYCTIMYLITEWYSKKHKILKSK